MADKAHFWLNRMVNKQNCCFLYLKRLVGFCTETVIFLSEDGQKVNVNSDMAIDFFHANYSSKSCWSLWFQPGPLPHTSLSKKCVRRFLMTLYVINKNLHIILLCLYSLKDSVRSYWAQKNNGKFQAEFQI